MIRRRLALYSYLLSVRKSLLQYIRQLMTDKKKVAILGLGAMGRRMAANLLNAGYPVYVYNRSEEPAIQLEKMGAVRVDTPSEAARQADVVLGMVSDNDASRAIWLGEEGGAIHGVDSNTIAVTSSTLTPSWSQELASTMLQHGVAFLEAPVVGTLPQADDGALVYLVGGVAETLEKVRDVFDVLGAKVIHLGPVGEAMKMKLIINAMLGIEAAMLGEMIARIRATMTNPEQKIEMLKALPVMSPLMTRLLGKMLPENYAPNFPIRLVEKDLKYFVEMAGNGAEQHSFVDATRGMYASAIAAGFGDDDITGIRQLFE